jgi:hypothetical protein
MKIDYLKLKELNREAVTESGEYLSCYYLIQQGVERFLNGDTISEVYKKFLMEVGVLINESEERKNIVEPFNFMGNDRSQSN